MDFINPVTEIEEPSSDESNKSDQQDRKLSSVKLSVEESDYVVEAL